MTLITLENRTITSRAQLEAGRNTYQKDYSAKLDRYGEEFPVLVVMSADVLDFAQANTWLSERVGEVQQGWHVVPEFPSNRQDTFMFRERDREVAMLFRLSF